MLITDNFIFHLVDEVFGKNGKGSDFYDVDMFLGDIKEAIENVLKNGYNNEPVFTDSDTYCEIMAGFMGWLRSTDSIDNWNDWAACILFTELKEWAARKFRSEEDK